MSNVEARVPHSLSPTPRGSSRRGRYAHANTLTIDGRRGRRRRLILAAGRLSSDIVSGSAAIVLVGVVANVIGVEGDDGFGDRLRMQIPTVLALLVGINYFLGVYDAGAASLMERFRLRAKAMLLSAFAGILVWGREGSSVDVAVIPVATTVVLVFGCWTDNAIQALLIRLRAWGAPTGILGAGPDSQALARQLASHPVWGLRPVAFVDLGGSGGDDPVTCPSDGNDAALSLPVLDAGEGSVRDVAIETVIVPSSAALPSDPALLYRLGARQVLVVNQVGGLASADVQVRHFDRFVALELSGRPNNPSEGMKRAIDLATALPLALLAAPVIGLLAVLIKVVDPGPAFHRQSRIGRNGTRFELLKLRTMYGDAEERLKHVLAIDAALREEWRIYFKLSRDPRILPHIGHLLRRTSLDELPQLWNIIRGDMSLVGPRPFPVYHMDAFDSEFRNLRVSVPPGLTGLWQISSRSDGNLDIQRAQDSYYIRNRSIWLDLYILIATLPAVIGGRGAR